MLTTVLMVNKKCRAGNGIRTRMSTLEGWHNSHYIIPAKGCLAIKQVILKYGNSVI